MRNRLLRYVGDRPTHFVVTPLAGIAVVGAVMVAFGLSFPRPASGGVGYLYIFAVNVILLFSITVIMSAYLRMKERNRQLKLILQRYQTRFEQSRARVIPNQAKLFEVASSARNILQIALNLDHVLLLNRRNSAEIHATSYESLKEIVNKTRDLFSRYTELDCAISIKLLRYPKTEDEKTAPYVFTFFRDSRSTLARRDADETLPAFPYLENSAFVNIIHDPTLNGYFYCNDLIDLEARGKYKNSHNGWKQFYDATAAAAIRDPDSRADRRVLGFICVDNFGGNFDDAVCAQMLGSVADELYYILTALSQTEALEPELPILSGDSTLPGWSKARSVEYLTQPVDPQGQRALERAVDNIIQLEPYQKARNSTGAPDRSREVEELGRSPEQGMKRMTRLGTPRTWAELVAQVSRDADEMSDEEIDVLFEEAALEDDGDDDEPTLSSPRRSRR